MLMCWMLFTLIYLLPQISNADLVRRPGYGLVGYGIELWQPICASACRSCVASALVQCPDEAGDVPGNETSTPTPSCYATNDAFLQSMAWCMSQRCQDVSEDRLERYWINEIPGEWIDQPVPKSTYKEALDGMQAPTDPLVFGEPLLRASLVSDSDYQSQANGMETWVWVEVKHETYGLLLLVCGSVVPVLLSLLRFVPVPAIATSRLRACFIDAPAFRTDRWQIIFGEGLVPSRGQALFVLYFWLINIYFSAAGYRYGEDTTWWSSDFEELGRYVANRTGVLSIANLALMVLWAGRNNFLLYLTDWSASTFLLLHRWLAFISIIQAAIHSLIFLYGVLASGGSSFDQLLEPYWLWGSLATLAMCLAIPFSLQQVRKRFYELFLASHITLALLTCLGYYLHIYCLYQHQLGYENWVYMALAIWAIDRIARFLRVVRFGVKTAHVSIIDEDYIKLEIPGISAAGEVYLYFPTLTWRVWENHPFSIANTTRRKEKPHEADMPLLRTKSRDSAQPVESSESDSERSSLLTTSTRGLVLTILVRTHAGVTSLLRRRERVPVLIEGSYNYNDSTPNTKTAHRLVCIAGGVGVTAVAPMLSCHASNRKLYWGVRTPGLVTAMQSSWDELDLSELEMDVRIGERLDLPTIIQDEILKAGDKAEPITFAVSGPPSMADEVRAEVSRLALQTSNTAVSFIEKSFSW